MRAANWASEMGWRAVHLVAEEKEADLWAQVGRRRGSDQYGRSSAVTRPGSGQRKTGVLR